MKECFICYDNILHSVKFNCHHEICIYCFMKLKTNLCPYCRFPMYKVKIIHYSTHVPLLLRQICKPDDIFSYILLQIYHSNPKLISFNELSNDIYKWNIPNYVKKIYIHEIMVIYKFIHPEKKQLLFFLTNLLFVTFFFRNEMFNFHHENYPKQIVQIDIYPVFIMIVIITTIYTLIYLLEYKSLKNFDFKEREKIKIENIMEY